MKILLVDDHEMVRLGLKSYFDLQDDVEVVVRLPTDLRVLSWHWNCVQMSLSWISSCLR